MTNKPRFIRNFVGGMVAVLAFVALGGASVSAQGHIVISVAVAYHKSGDKYNIVVKNIPGTKMELYVNDKNPTKATANKDNWATFNGVMLTGSTGKLSFTKVVSGKQKPINYTRRYTIKNGQVSFDSYAAGASTGETSAQQISIWYSKYGSSIIALTNDFGDMSNDTSNSALESTCTQIFNDAVYDEGKVPPIPDKSIENDWADALNEYVNAAEDCQFGVNNGSTSQISKATSEFKQGNVDLQAAVSAVNALK